MYIDIAKITHWEICSTNQSCLLYIDNCPVVMIIQPQSATPFLFPGKVDRDCQLALINLAKQKLSGNQNNPPANPGNLLYTSDIDLIGDDLLR